jgi:protein-tyrosine-phosphatase
MSEPRTKTILFVCTGNSCRSPMAEYLFRARAGRDCAWRSISAGTHAPRGMPASPEAILVMSELGIDLAPHRSQPVTQELLREADLVVALASHHAEFLRARFPEAAGRVRMLKLAGDPARGGQDVADPIGQSVFVYRSVRNEIDSALSDLILDILAPDPAQPNAEKGEQP